MITGQDFVFCVVLLISPVISIENSSTSKNVLNNSFDQVLFCYTISYPTPVFIFGMHCTQ